MHLDSLSYKQSDIEPRCAFFCVFTAEYIASVSAEYPRRHG